MALLELINKIDGLISSGAAPSAIRNQLVILREQAETVEQHLSAFQTVSQDKALVAEIDRLKDLLFEAYDTIDKYRAEEQQRYQESEPQKPIERPPIVCLSHAQMLQSIEAVPPFQQMGVMKTFVGKRVCWLASLDLIAGDTSPVFVACDLLEGCAGKYDKLHCWTPIDSIQPLAGVQKGSRIKVTGTIKAVSNIGTTLCDCTFEPET